MRFILRLLTWWDSQTLGTQLYTSRNGHRVGEDEEGNVYYTNADGSRRWVIYNGDMEASRVSPEWHGWLHQTFDQPPTEKPLFRQPWETPHSRNLTGSEKAYVPAGSLRSAAPAPQKNYVAWEPAAASEDCENG